MKKAQKIMRLFKPSHHSSSYIRALERRKIPYMIRKTPFIVVIIAQDVEVIFLGEKRQGKMPINQLWLFGAVKKDAIRFLKNDPYFAPRAKLPTNVYNKEYDLDKGIITGTDIISAYWTIAYQMGIISPRTFDKASDKRYKITKLASLAVLGREVFFDEVDAEGNVKRVVTRERNDELREIYRAIRYECYFHMGNLAMILGQDFFAYKTDCIYYRDTAENRKKVYDYMDENKFLYSQMVYGEEKKDIL